MGSSDSFTPTRRPRYPFVATVKATDVISGMQLVGLTTDLSEGGCRMSTRKGPFSEGTRILVEITKNDVSLLTNATVVYNLKDKFMGISFEEMPPDQAAILAGWIKAATVQANSRLTSSCAARIAMRYLSAAASFAMGRSHRRYRVRNSHYVCFHIDV